MRDLLDLLTTTVATDAALGIWDVQPDLGLVIIHDGEYELVSCDLPDQYWSEHHPVETVGMVAFLVREHGFPEGMLLEECEFVGVALYNEGWMLKFPKDAPESEMNEAMEWCQTHSIEEHPNRAEVKILSAITAEAEYSVSFIRGSDAPESIVHYKDDGRMVEGNGTVYPQTDDPAESGFGGVMHEALSLFHVEARKRLT